ncbi:hypothetical protein HCN44_005596 [Aphidius gifuensis]|uniref:RRM domain-containing protein n=1 Tax=Aphidius gifuensis TaxID=684658 RepID=A0A835CUT4_APHGI|nr:heterogeneous nuclear ribonucleoprotein M [Aphidius gifuensis]XP_044001377.1 heterogeneous nuclear ribonucleoprotein M [Aphidius gifuensis]KAF7997319.1 hypothetical protein HCN44_005596 [Aphidius gifuensis]
MKADDSPMPSDERERSRERDRSRRSERQQITPKPDDRDRSREKNDRGRRVSERRIYVSNIPYDYRWQDLKDLFRDSVGKVTHVELFTDESEKPRGCGIVEFEDADSVKVAVEKMHRHDIRGRKLVVKEDYDVERDKYGRLQNGRDNGNREDRYRDQPRTNQRSLGMSVTNLGLTDNTGDKFGNTYGLSTQFLESLGINGSLVTRVFVANLDYKVDEKKLLEVFKLAGKVINIELGKDKEGKSRGFGVVEYDHPVESVQAISMLHNQQLFDRRMTVRMDRANDPDVPPKLPEGLKGIGMGLGAGGNRLMDVARNIPNVQTNNTPVVNTIPTPVLATNAFGASLNNVVPSQLASALSNSNAAALQASLQANLTQNSLLNPSLTSDLATNLSNFNTNSLSSLQASLAANNQTNNTFAPRGIGKLDTDVSFSNNNAFGNSTFTTRSDFDAFGRNNSNNNDNNDRMTSAASLFTSNQNQNQIQNQNQQSTGNRQNSNGSRLMSDTILIGNLPPTTTWQMLRDKFQDVGDVKFAEMRGNEVGIVRFSSEWDAERAVSIMNRSRIDNRTIEVRLC